VKLHFAEIILRDNISFYGVGRRMFDVYIQVQVVNQIVFLLCVL
jgi:hypothetical protein